MKKFVMALTFGASLFTAGCASGEKKKEVDLDRTVHAQEPANTPQEISEQAAQAFANGPGLSNEQKLQLLGIYSRTRTAAMSIRTDLGKSKVLLFRLVASQNYNSSDVAELKKRIVKLDNQRLEIMFKALQDVQEVVGFGDDKRETYEHFRHYQIPVNTSFGFD